MVGIEQKNNDFSKNPYFAVEIQQAYQQTKTKKNTLKKQQNIQKTRRWNNLKIIYKTKNADLYKRPFY